MNGGGRGVGNRIAPPHQLRTLLVGRHDVLVVDVSVDGGRRKETEMLGTNPGGRGGSKLEKRRKGRAESSCCFEVVATVLSCSAASQLIHHRSPYASCCAVFDFIAPERDEDGRGILRVTAGSEVRIVAVGTLYHSSPSSSSIVARSSEQNGTKQRSLSNFDLSSP